MHRLVTIGFAMVLGCGGAKPPTPTPSVDDGNCTEPRPSADAVCMQDCGPPVARPEDPPPPWRWLSPEEVAAREMAGCPRCLPVGTLIETPSGPVAVEDLAAGAPVWSMDADGRRIAVAIARVGSVVTPASHVVIVLGLDDGRTVTASAGHPTVDGRPFGTLVPGDLLDGARIVTAARQPYAGGRTYDLLPASPTRAYWAGGVLIGSTLR